MPLQKGFGTDLLGGGRIAESFFERKPFSGDTSSTDPDGRWLRSCLFGFERRNGKFQRRRVFEFPWN